MTTIKSALVGFGISGQSFQTPILKTIERIELTSVVSSDPNKVKQSLANVTVYPDIDTLLTKADIDLVIIATPNDSHYPLAEKALLAGKHVVIEKPFVIESVDGYKLIELAKEVKRKLSVYQSRRFDGDFLTIKQLIEEGALGNIHTFYSSYNRYRPEVKERWREKDIPGAGILYDLGSHLIDQALCLFGMPDAVMSRLRKQRPGAQAVDHFHLILSYPELDVILHGNCLSTAEGPRFQVFGSEGSFIKYGMDPQEEFLRELKGPETTGWGEDLESNYGRVTDQQGTINTIQTAVGGYQAFYQQMVEAISSGSAVPVEPKQALDVIRVIEAAYQSQNENRTIYISNE